MSSKIEKISVFVRRLKKVGVEVEIVTNYPWIYLDKVDGTKVKEKFYAEHGFTIAFLPARLNQPLDFTDIGKIFKIIRKYKKQ